MPPKNQPPDSAISRIVTRQLASCGLRAPCQIRVQTRKGEVTLTGFVIYAHQKVSAVQSIQKVEGVRRVIDQMKIRSPVKHDYKTLPSLPKPAVAETAADGAEAEGDAAPSGEAPADAATPATAEAAPRAEQPSNQIAAQPIVPEVLSDSTEFELGPVPVVRQNGNAPAHK
jgi:BON domain-containing protein